MNSMRRTLITLSLFSGLTFTQAIASNQEEYNSLNNDPPPPRAKHSIVKHLKKFGI